MKFSLERNELLKALTHVTGVVERRSTIPILSHVMLQADGNALALTATDLDIEVRDSISAQVERSGGITVQAHVIHEIVRKFSSGAQVSFEKDEENSQVVILSGASRFNLQSLPADDFPTLEAENLNHEFEVIASQLKLLLEKTRFAISTEETRYYLTGIFMHPGVSDEGKETLRSVATDGHRLAQCEIDLPEGAGGIPGVIIPGKTVKELHRLLDKRDDKVLVALSETKIKFGVGAVTLTSKLIDGTFPDYARVIPKNNDKLVAIGNDDFLKAVERVATLSSDKGRAIKMSMHSGEVILSVDNPDSGSATEKLETDYQGEDLEIGFNARYLMDISGQLSNDMVNFHLADAGAPTIIRDGEDMSSLYVLMPMRV